MNQEQKIDSIYKIVNEQNVQLAKFMAHQEQHRKEIDANTKRIDNLIEIKNRAIGVVITISAAVSFIGIIIGIIIKH